MISYGDVAARQSQQRGAGRASGTQSQGDRFQIRPISRAPQSQQEVERRKRATSPRQRESGIGRIPNPTQREPFWPEGLPEDFDPTRDRPRLGEPDFIARMRIWRDNMALWARTKEGSQSVALPPVRPGPPGQWPRPPVRPGPGFEPPPEDRIPATPQYDAWEQAEREKYAAAELNIPQWMSDRDEEERLLEAQRQSSLRRPRGRPKPQYTTRTTSF